MLSGVALPPYAFSGGARRSGGAGSTPLGVSTAAGRRPSRVVAWKARSSFGSGGMNSWRTGPSATARRAPETATSTSTARARSARRKRRMTASVGPQRAHRTRAGKRSLGSSARIGEVRARFGRLDVVELGEVERDEVRGLGEDVDGAVAEVDLSGRVTVLRVDDLHPSVVEAAHADVEFDAGRRERFGRLAAERARFVHDVEHVPGAREREAVAHELE